MDFASPTFSFDQNTNIDLLDSFSFPDFQPDDFLLAFSEDTDFLIDQTNKGKECGSGSGGGGRKRRKAPEPNINIPNNNAKDDQTPIDPKRKKMIHRDLERQRRQEMATLYGSLRSLLPPESLKGKRSTSDHMDQAVTYIKHMQKKMKELKEKRDELKMLSNISCNSSSSFSDPKTLLQQGCTLDTVIVRPCLGGKGVEVVISSALKQSLPLSNVLKALTGEGLIVVNCISTKVDQTLIHTIVSEVTSERVICPSKLQKKLEDLALFSTRVDFGFDLPFDGFECFDDLLDK